MIKHPAQADSTFILKLVAYLALGSVWIKINDVIAIPAGLILGLALSSHDRLKIDRKIEYAVLLSSALVGLAGAGLYLGIIV